MMAQKSDEVRIEATARANVPQRCLEQGFARAVICRNDVPGQVAAISNTKHLRPGQVTASSPIEYLHHGQATASSGEDTEVA